LTRPLPIVRIIIIEVRSHDKYVKKGGDNTTDKSYELIPVKERLERGEVKSPEPIISGLLFRRSLAVIGAPEDSFKTHFALQLALSLSTGIQCYTHSCVKSQVVYLVLEGGEVYMLERLEEKIAAMGVNRDEALNRIYVKDCSQLQLDDKDTIQKLQDALLKLNPKPDVIILDPITYALNEDVRFSPEKAKLCRNLQGLASTLNGAVIPIVHCRKGSKDNDSMEDFLGTSIVSAAAATRIKLFRNENHLNVYSKTRYAERPDKISLLWKAPLLEVSAEELKPRQEIKKAILEILESSANNEFLLSGLIEKVSRDTKHNSKTVRAVIENLTVERKVKVSQLPNSAVKKVRLLPYESPIRRAIQAS
jgi:hypothetical protein